MGDILSFGKRKIRKKQQCFGCGRIFEKGSELNFCNHAYEGTVSTTYTCQVCQTVIEKGDYWKNNEEMYFCDLTDWDVDFWNETKKQLENEV